MYDIAQIGPSHLMRIHRRYHSELLPICPSERQRLIVFRLHRNTLRHRRRCLLLLHRCRHWCTRDLHLLQLATGRHNTGHLWYDLLRLNDIRYGGGGQLHRKVDGLIDGLAIAGGDGHLDGDGLLHGELDHLGDGGGADGHTLAIG